MKLANERGDLVQLISIDESFLSDMMFRGVLTLNKKRAIQMVCGFVLILYHVTELN